MNIQPNGGSTLKIPCEVAVKSVVPAIRALIAIRLVEEHSLKQDEVAEILGTSQSAISKYTTKVRGSVLKLDNMGEIEPVLGDMISLLTSRTCKRAELLEYFCKACTIIREKGLMCRFCEKSDSKIAAEKCSLCRTAKPIL